MLQGHAPLSAFARVDEDLPELTGPAIDPEGRVVAWRAQAEWRQRGPQLTGVAGAQGAPDLWLRLTLEARVPQTCQRCLQPYAQSVEVDRWFRFVKDEATALAEDDEAEEDLLVLEPRFDLTALVEDELLMALPLVPMHDVCPQPLLSGPATNEPAPREERPNPFAALATLKARGGSGGQGS